MDTICPTMMYAQPPSPAHAMAAQVLTGSKIRHYPNVDAARYGKAIAAVGAGLHHQLGELTIAVADDELDNEKFTCGAIFTDRRMLAREGETIVDIAYPDIGQVEAKTGIVLDDLNLFAAGRWHKLSGFVEVKAIGAFLQAMQSMHPAYRVPPPRPLITPSPEDPTGAGGARMGIWSGDGRIMPLLGMAFEGHRMGWFPAEAGADLAARTMLYDRTLAGGRGSLEGWWTSPLGAPDLAYAFMRMLGPALSVHQEGNARVFQFRLGGGGGNVARAAASTAVGLVALGVLGVGWVSTPGKQLRDFYVRIAPGASSTGFTISDGQKPLSLEWPRALAPLFEGLTRIEGRLLLQRAAWGWDASPEELDNTPIEALYQKAVSAIGNFDISRFFPAASR